MKAYYGWRMPKDQWSAEKAKLKLFCRGYYGMIDELEAMEEDLKPGSPSYDGMPKAGSVGSVVEKKAIRLAFLQDQVDMIRLAAEQADFEMAEVIVEYAADGRLSYDALKSRGDIPTSRADFYRKIDAFYRCLYRLRCENANCSILRRRIKCGKVRRNWAQEKRRSKV